MPQSRLNLAPVSLLAFVTLLFAVTWSHDRGVVRACRPAVGSCVRATASRTPECASPPVIVRVVAYRESKQAAQFVFPAEGGSGRDAPVIDPDWLTKLIGNARRTR